MNEQKKLRPIVYRIYDELKKHIGEENAISGVNLSAIFGISQRQLRTHIRTIRTSKEFEKLIGSNNNGYYVCASQSEYLRSIKRLYSAAVDLFATANSSKTKAGLDGQMKLKLGEFYKDTFQAFGE